MIHDHLPKLVAAGARLASYNTPEYLRDVGTAARHSVAESDLLAGRVEALNNARPRPAIFFDCDGVLNEEPGERGVVTPDDVKISTWRRRRPMASARSWPPHGRRHQSATGREGFRDIRRALPAFWAGSKRCWRKTAACSIRSTSVRIIPKSGFRGRNPGAEGPM